MPSILAAVLLFSAGPSGLAATPQSFEDVPHYNGGATATRQDIADGTQSCALLPSERRDLGALLNAYRTANGRLPATLDASLTYAARMHSMDQAEYRRMAHLGSDNSNFTARTKQFRYAGFARAENVAWNQRTTQRVMAAWFESKGHRENMLLRDVDQFGVARACGPDGEPYWTMVFGNSKL